MRPLVRLEEPDELKVAKKAYTHIDSPVEAWKAFGDSGEKAAVRESLEIMQDFLCAYCENSLKNNAHIDHFEPKLRRRELTFDWENLVVSCTHHDSCGGKKGGRFDGDWINPYAEDPTGWFEFYSDGQIKPSGTDAARAEKVITDFGLDCPRLVRKRESVLKALNVNILALVDQPDALSYYLQDIDANTPFPTARSQLIDKLI